MPKSTPGPLRTFTAPFAGVALQYSPGGGWRVTSSVATGAGGLIVVAKRPG
ncbi:MAG: hypothetical protein H6671_06395 [Anaerolineaceae bacterium]|nr:hypothetical protein [Anaerolineaceae bacterium]